MIILYLIYATEIFLLPIANEIFKIVKLQMIHYKNDNNYDIYISLFFYFKICTRCHLKQKEEEISTEKALTAICEAKFGLGNNYLFY